MTRILARNNVNVLCHMALNQGWTSLTTSAPHPRQTKLRSPRSDLTLSITNNTPLFEWPKSHYAPQKRTFQQMTPSQLQYMLEETERRSSSASSATTRS